MRDRPSLVRRVSRYPRGDKSERKARRASISEIIRKDDGSHRPPSGLHLDTDRVPARIQRPAGNYGWYQVSHSALRRPWHEPEFEGPQRHAAERFLRSRGE